MTFELVIRTPDGMTRAVPLERDVTLGRALDVDLSYPADAALSRRHLAFQRMGDDWFVRDLKSKNGIRHNDVPVTEPTRLKPGDRIRAGNLLIEFAQSAKPAETVLFVEQAPEQAGGTKTVISSLSDALALAPTAPGLPEEGSVARRQMQALIRAGRELAGHQPLSELFETIVELATEAVKASRGVLMTLDDDQLVVRAAKGEKFRISTAVRDRVIRDKQSFLVQDTLLEEAFRSRGSIVLNKVRSFMAVPLQTNERVIGLIYVDVRNLLSNFTPDDLNLLTVLANVAAVRIEHERLAEVEQAERLLSRELEQAGEIQRGLLPTSVPDTPGLDVAAYNAPCRTVGGDYYDFMAYPDGSTGLVIADVAGKGMPAALLMSCVQSRVRLLTEEPGPLGSMVSRLNRSMTADCPQNRFITFFICRFDPATGTLVYCNAGHNPPLLLRASEEQERLEKGGMILGILSKAEYEDGYCSLRTGDVLVLYSDGLTEAVPPGSEEEFGEERLAKIIAVNRASSAAEILTGIRDAVNAWTQGSPALDDITLLVAKVTSTSRA